MESYRLQVTKWDGVTRTQVVKGEEGPVTPAGLLPGLVSGNGLRVKGPAPGCLQACRRGRWIGCPGRGDCRCRLPPPGSTERLFRPPPVSPPSLPSLVPVQEEVEERM